MQRRRNTRSQDSRTGHSSSTLQGGASGHSLESVELGVYPLTLFSKRAQGMRRPRREIRLESALFAPISAESPLTLPLWTGLTQLCGRMGPAASLHLHLAWPCSPLRWLPRAAITAIPRRVLAVTVTPRRGLAPALRGCCLLPVVHDWGSHVQELWANSMKLAHG